MIFLHTYKQVLNRTKTSTLRLRNPGDYLSRDRLSVVGVGGRIRWKVGQVISVTPARGKPAVCKIKILAIGLISDVFKVADQSLATREGFRSVESLLKTWEKMHGGRMHDAAWMIRFHLTMVWGNDA